MALAPRRIEPTGVMGRLGTKLMEMTPDTATLWRKDKHYPFQRKISPTNVDKLALEMTIGRFTPGTQIYICILPDGTEYIVNGNHTLEAIAKCGIPQIVDVLRVSVENRKEIATIYSTFDDGKKRGIKDVIRAHGNPIPEKFSGAIGAAVRVIMLDFFQGRGMKLTIPKSDIVQVIMSEYRDAAEVFMGVATHGPRDSLRSLKSGPVSAVALATMRYQPEKAAAFWKTFVQDNGLTQGMPQKTLLTYLRNASTLGGFDQRREACNAVALAWNAYYRGREITQLKAASFTNFHILGTTFEKGL